MSDGQDLFGERSGASISANGLYRYRLWRILGDGPTVVFLMLNPSTADAKTDDPTIRKCIGFAHRLGCGRLEVVNLFAWRATNPRELKRALDPVGRENDQTIEERCLAANLVIAAWGAYVAKVPSLCERSQAVRRMLARLEVEPSCYGRASGEPRHPLMLPYATSLEPL